MKKLSSILALAALLGLASSALADEKEAATTSTQNQLTATSQDENKDKPDEAIEKAKEATKEDSHSDED